LCPHDLDDAVQEVDALLAAVEALERLQAGLGEARLLHDGAEHEVGEPERRPLQVLVAARQVRRDRQQEVPQLGGRRQLLQLVPDRACVRVRG
jgi:hypothetical protein